ncbi:hypothetical protein FB567DRAFT_617463 [Paraphoma chrysanthemicola]|uniref:Uncharacterized protein n=1 Tax=Paraphoma chrysanthemicola TaxID=798071 RepID=A0A8K0R9L4_9PLEO|nr:hypothetical protein FB567DRAFT_617463 [Paraphoma chrysanthemicola]
MPRNGDGSSDNGPIEEHEIIHGAKGDKTLQHTKHVASMPKGEEGDALPGMNASGGVAAPINDASEEFGVNAPKYERLGDDEDLSGEKTYGSSSGNDRSGTSGSSQTHQGSSGSSQNYQSGTGSSQSHQGSSSRQQQSSASSGNSKSNDNSHDNATASTNDLEQVEREKAKRFVNLDDEDVQNAGNGNKSSNDTQRSSQRAPRDVGSKEDIEQLHGKTSGHDGKQGGHDTKKSGHQGSGQHGGHNHGNGQAEHDNDSRGSGHAKHGHDEEISNLDSMRHTAEKFVNLDD